MDGAAVDGERKAGRTEGMKIVVTIIKKQVQAKKKQ
jgi:hypothetical protein